MKAIVIMDHDAIHDDEVDTALTKLRDADTAGDRGFVFDVASPDSLQDTIDWLARV